MRLKSTLEQWNTLSAIDEFGSIQAASVALNKSHTTLIYSIKKLESQLNTRLVEVIGRKATLTKEGKTLLRHASIMLEQAKNLEIISAQLAKGTESEITVSIDHLCDKELLYRALSKFFHKNAMTSVNIIETSLSSTIDVVMSQRADIALITLPVTNFPAEALHVVQMVPVIASSHPLTNFEELTMSDLMNETQIVLRDLGSSLNANAEEDKDVGWLKAKRRITVDNFNMALQSVKHGLGFTRIPLFMYQRNANSSISKLNIKGANYYEVPLHITQPKGSASGPATQALYALILAEFRIKLRK